MNECSPRHFDFGEIIPNPHSFRLDSISSMLRENSNLNFNFINRHMCTHLCQGGTLVNVWEGMG